MLQSRLGYATRGYIAFPLDQRGEKSIKSRYACYILDHIMMITDRKPDLLVMEMFLDDWRTFSLENSPAIRVGIIFTKAGKRSDTCKISCFSGIIYERKFFKPNITHVVL